MKREKHAIILNILPKIRDDRRFLRPHSVARKKMSDISLINWLDCEENGRAIVSYSFQRSISKDSNTIKEIMRVLIFFTIMLFFMSLIAYYVLLFV
ncbi:hypothetical protein LSTR_LSTR001390 [Laodelphax striatellus]|uniref:Uncharacterized protein n=1 Tax=Laodelphax striatellus TaxID=195883 RepID=A0A482X9F5_LAOST|nr:hypothetical protein LSTR_LSTR001390 [Laodelphax striatellus]